MKHIHLIGIGGSGLSAIARVLLENGYTVSGSDRVLSPLALDLEKSGAKIFQGHQEKNIQGADLIVRSSAIPDDNPEVIAARSVGIPVQKRSDFLGNLISYRPDGTKRTAVAISGTHGKTTTTAMVTWLLKSSGFDPSFIIGGISKNLACNAHAGNGKHFVIEADEYDRMFLGLSPDLILLTNVQHDHPDCFPTRESYLDAYSKFIQRLAPGGVAISCADDEGALQILQHTPENGLKYTYGISEKANYTATELHINSDGYYTFDIWFNPEIKNLPSTGEKSGEKLLTTTLKIPGRHNVLNTTGAVAAVHQLKLNLSMEQIATAIPQFLGTGRRFDIYGEIQGVTIVDDYAHHPVEIKATISAAKDRYQGRRLWVVWQPHTYSRIKAMFDEFLSAFDNADEIIITEIYAAREHDEEFSSANIVAKMNHRGLHFLPKLDEVTDYLLKHLKPEDVLLVLSAGDADQISVNVFEGLKRRGQNER